MIQNIKHKYTTGAAILILVWAVLKVCGIDLEEKLNMPFDEMITIIGGALTSVILLFSRDPKDKKK